VNTSRKRLRRDADIRLAAAARRRRRHETSLFVESHLPSKVALSSMSSHEICLSPRRDSVRRQSRLDVLNSFWDYSTIWCHFRILHTNACTNTSFRAVSLVKLHTIFSISIPLLRYRLCKTFNIWHHVCHQISNRRSRNDVQPHDLNYEHFSVSNYPHTKSCMRTLVWPTRRTVMRVHCEKTSRCATFWLTWMCSHENFLVGARVCIQLVT